MRYRGKERHYCYCYSQPSLHRGRKDCNARCGGELAARIRTQGEEVEVDELQSQAAQIEQCGRGPGRILL